MAKNDITPEEEIQLSKRAYVRGFANTLLQAGKPAEESTEMAKKAFAHREQLYSEETTKVLEKRASDVKAVVLEIAGSKKAEAAG